ncbi:hypothetical protein AB837_00587 [bacterium AB1]|nr:hypothetical protein AB837_00587 [bacterium AB1]
MFVLDKIIKLSLLSKNGSNSLEENRFLIQIDRIILDIDKNLDKILNLSNCVSVDQNKLLVDGAVILEEYKEDHLFYDKDIANGNFDDFINMCLCYLDCNDSPLQDPNLIKNELNKIFQKSEILKQVQSTQLLRMDQYYEDLVEINFSLISLYNNLLKNIKCIAFNFKEKYNQHQLTKKKVRTHLCHLECFIKSLEKKQESLIDKSMCDDDDLKYTYDRLVYINQTINTMINRKKNKLFDYEYNAFLKIDGDLYMRSISFEDTLLGKESERPLNYYDHKTKLCVELFKTEKCTKLMKQYASKKNLYDVHLLKNCYEMLEILSQIFSNFVKDENISKLRERLKKIYSKYQILFVNYDLKINVLALMGNIFNEQTQYIENVILVTTDE